MWQFIRVCVLLVMMVGVSTGEKCFHCGYDLKSRCTHKMSNLSADTICLNVGSCLKFNGSAIILPGPRVYLVQFILLYIHCSAVSGDPFPGQFSEYFFINF